MSSHLSSREAEQAVLGACIIAKNAWFDVDGQLTVDDFEQNDHKIIFEAVSKILSTGAMADVVTVSEALLEKFGAEEWGGMPYVGKLATETPSAANIRAYVKVVQEKSLARSAVQALQAGVVEISSSGATAVEKVQADIAKLGEERASGDVVNMNQACTEWLADLQSRFERGGEIDGLSTGFASLDSKLGGMADGDLIVIAGRPSMGKTVMSQNIIDHNLQQGKACLFFSMEMPRGQIIQRMMCRFSGVNYKHLRTADLNDQDFTMVTSALSRFRDAKFNVCDLGGLNIRQLSAIARRANNKQKLDLIAIDYLQLMALEREYTSNPTEGLNSITRSLKALAKELELPIVLLSQLNRSVESRPDKRPMMSDLRSSGGIEQDADAVMMLYRDDFYDPEVNTGKAEAIFRKVRAGEVGTIDLCHDFKRMQFLEFDSSRVSNVPIKAASRKKGFAL